VVMMLRPIAPIHCRINGVSLAVLLKTENSCG